MTVRELIRILRNMPQGLEVYWEECGEKSILVSNADIVCIPDIEDYLEESESFPFSDNIKDVPDKYVCLKG